MYSWLGPPRQREVLNNGKKEDDNNNNNTTTDNFPFVKKGSISVMSLTLTSVNQTVDSALQFNTLTDLGDGKFEVHVQELKDLSSFPPANLASPKTTDTLFWKKTSSDLSDYDSDFSADSKSTIVTASPKVGDINKPADSTSSNWNKVLAVDKSITVPAGTFNCFVFREYDDDSPADSTTISVSFTHGIIKFEGHKDQISFVLISKNF